MKFSNIAIGIRKRFLKFIIRPRMSLRLYNTLTKREEDFAPQKAGIVTMYTCGPTVYGRPHVGNYSSFLMADLLRRWLESGHKFKVKHVKNITDVGHLVADQDSGEDKVEREARIEKIDPLEIARRYTCEYLEDERELNFLEPMARPRATEYIDQMIRMIQALIEKGFAYETEDGVYFSVEKFPEYGKLSGNTLENLSSGARIEIDESKRHPADFALWKKKAGKNASHILHWPSPFGDGFPGWHIECSAMSEALLGLPVDIHTGGEDNIFPHHECEIAQSQAASGGKTFVKYWLHRRRIDLGAEKMSKSLGNVLTIPDVKSKGYSPLDLRYYLLSVHYRTNLKFTWRGMDDARKSRLKIIEWMEAVAEKSMAAVPSPKGESDPIIKKTSDSFMAGMDGDLNTPAAIAEIFGLMNYFYSAGTGKHIFCLEDFRGMKEFIEMACGTFGCFDEQKVELPAGIRELISKREAARAKKDFKESDRLRKEIESQGYSVRDTGKGHTILHLKHN